ncbi:MAG TPA: tetratricopeptide repeat protein [Bryobacteraceae bacterium]|nr:tetratricopeptide repeat protein [Bryobacteraceae bacterium]
MRWIRRTNIRGSYAAAAIVVLAAAGVARAMPAHACKGAEAELAAATAALQRGDAADAGGRFTAVRAAYPDCPEAILGLGRAALAARDYQAGYPLLAQYVKLAPRDARGPAALAELLLEAGKPADADALSATAVATDPGNVEALVTRGRILGMKGESSQAEELLVKACKLGANHPQAHFELGVLYDRLQRNAKAAEQFETVTKLTPQNARAYDYLALNLEPLGQFERAERAYRQALEVNRPPWFDGFLDYNYGRFLMKRNRLQEAARHLDRAAEFAPDTRAVRYERAKLNERLGKYADARAEAERALALADPGGVILDLQVYYQLVRIYTRLGETELAARYTKLAEGSNVPLRSRMRGGR